jgi:3-isopropylmalate dehydratase small subunit
MEHVYHEFRSLVRGGQRVVVGGKAFGCGSSREQAVRALKGMAACPTPPFLLFKVVTDSWHGIGLGVQAVIARSFSFIYGRNQPSLGLLGIQLDNDDFFRLAVDQADIEIDVAHRLIRLAGRTFDFNLDEMEYRLTVNKGLQASYKKFGRDIWNYIGANSGRPRMQDIENFPMLEEKQKRSGIDW